LIIHRKGNKSPSDLKTGFGCPHCDYFYDISFNDLAYIVLCLYKKEDVLKEEKYNGNAIGGQLLLDYFAYCCELGRLPDISIQEFTREFNSNRIT